MSWDIYGHEPRRGYCEGYPCSVCQENQDRERARREYYDQQPGPCEGCWYATGHQQDCDGTCKTLPYPQWEYFKSHPDETPPELLPTMIEKPEVTP